jgi:hypothetical protein
MDSICSDPVAHSGSERSNFRRYAVASTLAFALLHLLSFMGASEVPEKTESRRLQEVSEKNRILYIVTTLAEYNDGDRATVKGSDRLQETLIPVATEGIRSMVEDGFTVDLFMVCHFNLEPEREELVRKSLPPGVGLQVWNDATPFGYDTGQKTFTKLEYRTLHLSRQHRFVIKDKIEHYDMFVNFEDDMLIKGDHVKHFIAVTDEIDRLRASAPDSHTDGRKHQDAENNYHGTMTKSQLLRTIPGFMRVEVLLDEGQYPAQKDTGPVPVDLDFPSGKNQTVNSTVCCHVSEGSVSKNRPAKPDPSQLMVWETNIMPLGVRQMPQGSWLDWVVTQRGPNQGEVPTDAVIGDYWTNRKKDFFPEERRPSGIEFKYINNQGGWMSTREQLWRWHTEICLGSFLPPYEEPHFRFDGLDMRNVEWYSGGMQLSSVRHACNMQRIISLDPQTFSKSLIYHSANNKQRQLQWKREKMFVKATTLVGQLNTIRKRAEEEMTA